ncbi:hypothetical protein HCA64_01310 [Listeria booriae]|uniref:Rad50/SbcC-type AAA domain-containing protein n=1 Tax=Listeria booriae TaxID=1552123 RepID=A0A099W6X4_9LIST|nr:hypothetical protein [Listeria booriae]KGL40496.1 hypothetical protein EP57_11445 [Listeria booriae]MBC1905103.1 hypothetical protein [Listeria booriae]STY42290.1 ATPase involved in DNA repair [Listeria booriae]
MKGFKITRLIVAGVGLEPVNLSFSTGINLVSGPSDTGKTYAFQCIDYILGSSSPPKFVSEGAGYDTVSLEIQTNFDNKKSVLSRSLNEKTDVFYYEGVAYEDLQNTEPAILSEKFHEKKPNISSLVLQKIGFDLPIKIKKSRGGAKNNFTFRYLAPLTLVKEDTMIQERSPIYIGGSYADRTLKAHTFKFLVTGNDDSELQEKDTTPIFNAKKTGNLEMLEKLQEKESRKLIDARQRQVPSISLSNNFGDILLSLQTKIGQLNCEIIELENEKQNIKNNIKYNEALQYKFKLLMEQYNTDIERLNFIDEGTFLLNQLETITCPYCGEAIRNDNEHEHTKSVIDTEQALQACESEIKKIKGNIIELRRASDTVASTIQNLTEDYTCKVDLIKVKKSDVTESLQPKIEVLNNELNRRLEYEKNVVDIVAIEQRIDELQTLIQEASSKKNTLYPSDFQNIILEINSSRFVRLFSDNLKAVIFNKDDTVEVAFFLNVSNEIDYEINGKDRGSYGKGFRSIIACIFYATLILFCEEKNLPFSPTLVLDSPINAFRDTKEGERLLNSIKNKFFKFLYENFKNKQVIIFENDTISEEDELYKKVNVIPFTKSNTGRYGFFPHINT